MKNEKKKSSSTFQRNDDGLMKKDDKGKNRARASPRRDLIVRARTLIAFCTLSTPAPLFTPSLLSPSPPTHPSNVIKVTMSCKEEIIFFSLFFLFFFFPLLINNIIRRRSEISKEKERNFLSFFPLLPRSRLSEENFEFSFCFHFHPLHGQMVRSATRLF